LGNLEHETHTVRCIMPQAADYAGSKYVRCDADLVYLFARRNPCTVNPPVRANSAGGLVGAPFNLEKMPTRFAEI
jgi:hypothetical protein